MNPRVLLVIGICVFGHSSWPTRAHSVVDRESTANVPQGRAGSASEWLTDAARALGGEEKWKVSRLTSQLPFGTRIHP
jgi:hypothetical protein